MRSFRFIDEAAKSETHEIYQASLTQGLPHFHRMILRFRCFAIQ